MTDLIPENPIEATPEQPPAISPESLAVGEIITSLPAVSQAPIAIALPTSIASDKLTEEHKHRFWEIAKTDILEALTWLKTELSKI